MAKTPENNVKVECSNGHRNPRQILDLVTAEGVLVNGAGVRASVVPDSVAAIIDACLSKGGAVKAVGDGLRLEDGVGGVLFFRCGGIAHGRCYAFGLAGKGSTRPLSTVRAMLAGTTGTDESAWVLAQQSCDLSPGVVQIEALPPHLTADVAADLWVALRDLDAGNNVKIIKRH